MIPMDADVADAQDEDGDEEDRVALVDRQEREGHDRQRRTGEGNPQHAAVIVLRHPLRPKEIGNEKHQQEDDADV